MSMLVTGERSVMQYVPRPVMTRVRRAPSPVWFTSSSILGASHVRRRRLARHLPSGDQCQVHQQGRPDAGQAPVAAEAWMDRHST